MFHLNSCTTIRERTDHSFNQYALSDYRLQWLALSFLNLIFHFVFCSLSTFLLYVCTVMWDNSYLLLFITFSSVYLMFSIINWFSLVVLFSCTSWKTVVGLYLLGGLYLSFYRFFCTSLPTFFVGLFRFSFVKFNIIQGCAFVNTFLEIF